MTSESPLNWDKIMEPTTNMITIDNNLLDSDVDIQLNYIIFLIIIILCLFFCLLLYNNNNINNKLVYNKNLLLDDNDDSVRWC